MYDVNWKCLICGNNFIPNNEGKYDFACPICGSSQTVPNRNKRLEENDNK
jgi:predicted RNA-binding Zn-ribbon protein involved in translation (DUF1610 family)